VENSIQAGSLWRTKTRRHLGHLRKVVGFNKNLTTVYVIGADKKHKQHAGTKYSISTEVFVREHEYIKG